METYTNRSKDLAMDEFTTLPRSGFGDCLIRENGLGRGQFERWLFYPGMLFEAANQDAPALSGTENNYLIENQLTIGSSKAPKTI